MPPAAEPQPFSPRALMVQLGLAVLAAAAAGLLLSLFWVHQGLGDRPVFGVLAQVARPQGWAAFAVVGLPAVMLAPSLAMGLLLWITPARLRAESAGLISDVLRRDAATYIFLPVMLLVPFMWRWLGNGLVALGLIYLGALTVKAALLGRLAWGCLLGGPERPPGHMGWRRHWAVGITVFTVLGLAAVWAAQAVSATPIEAALIQAVQELTGGGPAADYFWAGAAPSPAQGHRLLTLVMLPGFTLAGRLGVLLTWAALMAVMAGQLMAWLERAGSGRGAAALATGLVMASAPVLAVAQQAAAAPLAMLLWVFMLRLTSGLGLRTWACLAGLIPCGALLMALGPDYWPLALAALTWAGLVLVRLRWGRGAALAVGAGLALAAAAALVLPVAGWGPLGAWRRAGAALGDQASLRLLHAAAALFLDQGQGLLMTAPVWLLALAAVPAGLMRRTGPALAVLMPALVFLAALMVRLAQGWPAGPMPPFAPAAALLPGLALFLALAVSALARPGWRVVAAVAAALSVAYTWLTLLLTPLRFALPIGLNPLAEGLGGNLDLGLTDCLPAAFGAGPPLGLWAAALGLAWLVLALAMAWLGRKPAAAGRLFLGETALAPLAAAALAAAWLLCASMPGPRVMEAERMAGDPGLLAPAHPGDHGGGRLIMSGQKLVGRGRLAKGQASLKLTGEPRSDGRLLVALNGQLYERPWPAGTPEVELDLGPVERGGYSLAVGWSSCPGVDCALFLDRLELVTSP